MGTDSRSDVSLNGVAIDTDQSVALHYVLTIDTDQVAT